jgi:type IV pilus assembly protein PilV
MKTSASHQSGVSLIEVMVAILILSFGLLALGAVLAYAVQLPKSSGYRSTATLLAAEYIERIRVNPTGLPNGFYTGSSYDGTGSIPSLSPCTYPACTSTALDNSLGTMDKAYLQRALRQQLPNGGFKLSRATVGGVNSDIAGDLWIIWDEPSSFAALNSANSDNCPSSVATYTPQPRCLYVRFEL